MRIATVVGARPQFIKAMPVSTALRKNHEEILIHTGQHYGQEMSQIFFDELNLPKPDYALGLGGGHPGVQVGAMIMKLVEIFEAKKPDLVLVYGDTHSTLAGAVAAAKTDLPLAHVEAGLRSFRPAMQEEKNRVVTDHLSQILFCPTQTAVKNLKQESITSGIHLVGDVMVDALLDFLPAAEKHAKILAKLKMNPKEYLLATVHRAENADHPDIMKNLLKSFSNLPYPVIFPVHPRTQKELEKNHITFAPNIVRIEPVGYFDMLVLEKNAKLILTDSGGVQKEAYLLHTPCITLREETEWVETVQSGCNILAGANPKKIATAAKKLLANQKLNFNRNLFGPPNAAQKIAAVLSKPLRD